MTDDTWLYGYLGDTYADTTPEQRARIVAAQAVIERRWPEPDLEDVRMDALIASVQVILGETTLEHQAALWRAARTTERAAHAALTGALIASASVPERVLAERASLTRQTVRKALGK